jgi:hypothetical protein
MYVESVEKAVRSGREQREPAEQQPSPSLARRGRHTGGIESTILFHQHLPPPIANRFFSSPFEEIIRISTIFYFLFIYLPRLPLVVHNVLRQALEWKREKERRRDELLM